MGKTINSQSEKIWADSTDQYLIFQPVTTKDLAEIGRERDTIGRHARFTYDAGTNILVIKLINAFGDTRGSAQDAGQEVRTQDGNDGNVGIRPLPRGSGSL
jgi:hypothetical protein